MSENTEPIHGQFLAYLGRGVIAGARALKGIRAAGYASEAGVATKPHIPPWLYRTAWIVSIGYIGADITIDALENEEPVLERMAWHSMASLIFPAVTISSIVKVTSRGLNNCKNSRIRTYGPTGIGLMSIPFIIGPLDHLADFIIASSWKYIK